MTTASPEIKRVSDTPCAIGENPLWHPDERALYWTDIPNGKLYRLDPDLGITEPCYEGTPVGGFTVQESGALLLFMAGGSVAEWREGTRTYLIEGLDAESDSRFYCGTMPTGERLGRLYRLDRDGSIHVVLERVGLPNGMGFTPERDRFYHTDSRAKRIVSYRYDGETGRIDDPTLFVDSSDEEGVPDGLTVDAEGCVWSARWGGGRITRYDPDGRVAARIDIGVPKVSSVAFGGDDYQDLMSGALRIPTRGRCTACAAECGACPSFARPAHGDCHKAPRGRRLGGYYAPR